MTNKTNLNLNELKQDSLDLTNEPSDDSIEQSIPSQQSVQVNPTASTELIMLSSGTIHIGSITRSIDDVAAILLDLLKQKEVQAVINPTSSTKQGSYTN